MKYYLKSVDVVLKSVDSDLKSYDICFKSLQNVYGSDLNGDENVQVKDEYWVELRLGMSKVQGRDE